MRHGLADARNRRVVGRDLPDEQSEKPQDERERAELPCDLQPAGHAETMKTVVPTVIRLYNHSASGIRMRMQPCDTE